MNGAGDSLPSCWFSFVKLFETVSPRRGSQYAHLACQFSLHSHCFSSFVPSTVFRSHATE